VRITSLGRVSREGEEKMKDFSPCGRMEIYKKIKNMYDILIRGGNVYDGSGAPPVRTDIAIKDGHIHEIGEIGKDAPTRQYIDAGDLIVAPGFIDVNNHSDTHWRIFSDPGLESLLYQGITTMIGGSCGSSLAPLLRDGAIDSIRKWIDTRRVNVNWHQVRDLFLHLHSRGIPLNYGMLAGHSTIRRAIVGDEHRVYEEEELQQALSALDRSLSEGALGMSLGLAYSHAKAADDKEIIAMMKVVAQSNGIVSAHLRNESSLVDVALQDVITWAKESRARLHITHLKAMGRGNWDIFDSLLNRLEENAREDVSLSFDVFPYDFTGSVLYTMLPDWVSQGGRDAMLGRLHDQSLRRQVVVEMQRGGIEYERVHILSASFLDRSMTKKSITEIAQSRNVSPEEAVIDVLLSSEGRAIARMNVLSESHIEKGLKHPLSMVASDGSGYSKEYKKIGEDIHPRCFGAFPRFLGRYVRDKKLMSWEEALYKITGYPASRFGIVKRGLLKEGYHADVVVFDPKSLRDEATVRNPFQYARGMENVIINGESVLDKGKISVQNAGMILRHQ